MNFSRFAFACASINTGMIEATLSLVWWSYHPIQHNQYIGPFLIFSHAASSSDRRYREKDVTMLWNIYSNIPNVLIGKPHHNPNLNGNDQIQTLKKIELISCITRNIHHRRLRKCKLENLYLINSTSVRTYTWPPTTFYIHTFSIWRSSFIFTRVWLVCVCLQIFRLFFVCSAIFFRLLWNIFFVRYSSRFSVTSSQMLCSYPLLAFCVHITQFRGKWKIKRTEKKSERWKVKNRISFCKLIQFLRIHIEFSQTIHTHTYQFTCTKSALSHNTHRKTHTHSSSHV